MDKMINWAKEQFPLIKNNTDICYLDSAATTQKPMCVIDAVSDYNKTTHSNIHRGLYELSMNATKMVDDVRGKVRELINAKKTEEIVFTKGTTDSFNLLAFSYGETNIEKGDEIVISVAEHHSNILPWQQLCKRKGAILKYLPVDDSGKIIVDKLDEVITDKTKLVSVTMTSNALGTKQPVKEIIRKAHLVGALIALDGAQSVPHEKVDVTKLDCDFLAFSAHKMFGPTGVGVLYGKSELLEQMSPYQTGGDMIEYVELFSSTYAPVPTKFEAGTPNIEGIVGFGAAIDFINKVGYDAIVEREKSLTKYAYEKLGELDIITIHGTDNLEDRGSVISFSIKDVHPHDVATILSNDGVCIRAGHHCAQPLMKRLCVPSTTRASFSIYNTYEDIDRLVESVKQVRKWLGYES